MFWSLCKNILRIWTSNFNQHPQSIYKEYLPNTIATFIGADKILPIVPSDLIILVITEHPSNWSFSPDKITHRSTKTKKPTSQTYTGPSNQWTSLTIRHLLRHRAQKYHNDSSHQKNTSQLGSMQEVQTNLHIIAVASAKICWRFHVLQKNY